MQTTQNGISHYKIKGVIVMWYKKPSNELSKKLYRAEQVRKLELRAASKAGVTGLELMEQAGALIFEHSVTHFPEAKHYLIVVGTGNNAGDGYVAALRAQEAGKTVTLCSANPNAAPKKEKDVATVHKQWLDAGGSIEPFHPDLLNNCDLVIDALLGIGAQGDIVGDYKRAIEALNASSVPVISADIPSGLDANTGKPLGCNVQADFTITFIAVKQGMVTGSGKQACGKLILEDLGIAEEFAAIADPDVSLVDIHNFALSERPENLHKGKLGRLLCIGGNEGMAGAIRMSAEAALRCGAGLVKVYCHELSRDQISAGRPELMIDTMNLEAALDWCSCIVVGPGLGLNEWGRHTLETVIRHMSDYSHRRKPIVMDADALTIVAELNAQLNLPNCVITPHPGEAARLLDTDVTTIESNRFHHARQCSKRYNATCVLKGAGTLIDCKHQAWICPHGNPGMATGGMGDVLTGIIGALLAQGMDTTLASKYGVVVHAKAADIVAEKHGQIGMLASDLFQPVRALINRTA